jgi:hypothetical protein
LLIEDPDSALRVADFRLFYDSGLEVARCAGPDDREACPLVEHGRCLLVEQADVVLMGPGLADRDEVARAIRHHRPSVPVVVPVVRGNHKVAPPEGCVALPFPSSVEWQVEAVWRALEGARQWVR